MGDYDKTVSTERVQKTAGNLTKRGFETFVVKNGAEALAKVKSLLNKGEEVFTMSSITLETTGIATEINESGNYDPVRTKLYSMDQKTQGREMRKYGAAPDVAIGSVHAITEEGVVLVASLTGSQLPAYAAGSEKVIFVVGSQKIVANLDDAMKRLDSHVIPLESVRAQKAYGLPVGFKSAANKILLLQGEINPGRVKIVLVEEVLGF